MKKITKKDIFEGERVFKNDEGVEIEITRAYDGNPYLIHIWITFEWEKEILECSKYLTCSSLVRLLNKKGFKKITA